VTAVLPKLKTPSRPVDAAASHLVRTVTTIATAFGAALVALGATSLHVFPAEHTESLVAMGLGVGLSMLSQVVNGSHHSAVAKELGTISKIDPALGAAGNWVEQRLSNLEGTLASHAQGLAAVSSVASDLTSLRSQVDTLATKVTESTSVRHDASGAAQEGLLALLEQLSAHKAAQGSGAPLVEPSPADSGSSPLPPA